MFCNVSLFQEQETKERMTCRRIHIHILKMYARRYTIQANQSNSTYSFHETSVPDFNMNTHDIFNTFQVRIE